MNEGISIAWMWMWFPVMCVAVNLVWPRKRSVKAVGLVLLLLAAYLYGFSGLNPLDRAVGLAERIVMGEQVGTPEQVVSNLRIGQALAHQTMFGVSLGLTLAAVFASTPVGIITRLRSRPGARPEAEGKSRNA